MRVWIKRMFFGTVGLIILVLAAWSIAIGPVSVWRVITNGTTTVWDHLEYPGTPIAASDNPQPWPTANQQVHPSGLFIDSEQTSLESLLVETPSLAFVIIKDGELISEWYAPEHGPGTPSMLFSISKSIVSLLIGTAIDDGFIESAEDPVTAYIPEMEAGGFDAVTIEDLLRMDSSMDYYESDNPFGEHVEFNYTPRLRENILALTVLDEKDPIFRYKSGDNALLSLVLERALDGASISGYMADRLWTPMGVESAGTWSTDREGGFERSWCCLAMTARDLARFGQLMLDDGIWRGTRLVSENWIKTSIKPSFEQNRWPEDYGDSPLGNYGYQWWVTDAGKTLAIGKDGQYLYVDPEEDLVIVRLGEGGGEVPWVTVMEALADQIR